MEVSVSDAGEQFTQRVQRAATRVLGDSDAGIEIVELCRHHHEARSMVIADRADNATVVAIVGTTGQGKSWLARQLVGDPAIAAAIRSGNNLDEATEKLTWVGPKPPSDLDTRHERYLVCDASKMQSIGGPYLIVDAPGSTDDRRAIAGVAERALSLASVLVLVVRRDQLRSQRVTGLASASEGTIVIPVVNMVGVDEFTPASGTAQRADVDNDLTADIETLVSRLRSVAPQSSIASAVMIRDFEIDPRGEEEIGKQAAEEIAGAISEALAESGGGDHRRSTRLSALDARFTAAVGSVLTSQLPELTAAVDRLDAEARRLPTQIASTLLGGEIPLKAAIRSRLRLSLLSETAAIWFPYRTVLSVLNLTHGAWDRVLLSFSGSIPSLVGAVYTSVQNIRGGHESALDLRNGLRQRASTAVTERLGPMASRFRRELNGLHRSGTTLGEVVDDDSPVATLAGVDALQEGSQAAFEETIAREGVSGTFAFLAGLIGTIIFWALMAGPLVALYHNYLDASYVAIGNLAGGSEPATTEAVEVAVSAEHANDWLQRFPHPSAGMLFTSVLLSLLPMAIFAMIVLSVCQGRRRIERIARSLRTQHDAMIETLQRDGVLRLRWSDPILADAEFLLSIGRMAKTNEARDTPVVSEDAK
ncbi:putative membrane protein [Rhodopirellula sallentina SM41]|uniref:Putative membrane protein n=2 Tax=Rhodopirellula TaxID=265488 RepID=M5U517_9BACT|nr:putative membrane protein [Rhodopirellula sallentina SM41]